MLERQKKHIFVVEDNDLNLKLFRDLLESADYRVTSTKNGSEAVKMALSSQPDLIIMDIQLHDISGYDIIKGIREQKELKKTPIIAVTAFAMRDDKERILACGCNDYISKPISIGPFLQAVKKLVTSSRQPQEAGLA